MTERSDRSRFIFEEKEGDLFKCPASFSLAHCVSADLVMGRCIAREFSKRYGGKKELKEQGPEVGGTVYLKNQGRMIYYLVTKKRFFQKPTGGALLSTLVDLRQKMKEHGIRELAIPKIGCGLDRLNWEDVKKMICDVFALSDAHIVAYLY